MDHSIPVFHDSSIRMGYHITKRGTLENTFASIINTPLRSYQLYLGNSRSWKAPVVDIPDISKAREMIRKNGKYVCVHASLLYNIAGATNGPDDPKYSSSLERTRNNLMTELDVAAAMGAGVVVHTGSRRDKSAGLETTADTINYVLRESTRETRELAQTMPGEMTPGEFIRRRKVIVENSAGEGNKLGSTLQSIADIIEAVDEEYRDQVKVCIDTAHSAASGEYDFGLSDEVVRFYSDFDNIIGLDRLELFHLNDSRSAFASKRDLHENLGLGHLFTETRDDGNNGMRGLCTFIEYAQHHRIPFIGEPPAKTRDGLPGPGGRVDYEVIKKIYNIERRPDAPGR